MKSLQFPRASIIILAMLAASMGPASAAFNESINPLGCQYEPDQTELSQHCQVLKIFNRLEVDEMAFNETLELARTCACELNNLDWEEAYDDQPYTRTLAQMVDNVLSLYKYSSFEADHHHHHHQQQQQQHQRQDTQHEQPISKGYPAYLWSDIDVVMSEISIYAANKDFFVKIIQSPSMAVMSFEEMLAHRGLMVARVFCGQLALDSMKLYQYLENVGRLNPSIFFELLETNDMIRSTYQASKACKLLLIHRLNDFKLYPDNRDLIVVDGVQLPESITMRGRPNSYINNNNIDYMTARLATSKLPMQHDIDRALKYLSVHLMNCRPWQAAAMGFDQLKAECPMTLMDELPVNWTRKYPSQTDQARMAIRCGCQLLLHNNTWAKLMDDPDIGVLNKALVNYINENRFPHFEEVPLWGLYGWFNDKLGQLATDRTSVIDHLVKAYLIDQSTSEDPTSVIKSKYHPWALKVLRRACNLLIFNQKGTMGSGLVTQKGVQLDGNDLKLIKYLDNLKVISQDPLFVFHLTLQNANLFKLHSLARMCEPIVK